jgi:hypothetical protein
MIEDKIPKENESSIEDIDSRIKRFSRKFHSSLVADRKRMEGLREYWRDLAEYYWDSADLADRELKKRLRRNPAWKNDRPNAADVKETELRLKKFVGSDIKKFAVIEKFLSLMPAIQANPHDSSNIIERWSDAELKELMKMLMRGEPGRHELRNEIAPDGVFAQAYPLWKNGAKLDSLARQFLPLVYKQDRAKARNRMKSGLNRQENKVRKPPDNS